MARKADVAKKTFSAKGKTTRAAEAAKGKAKEAVREVTAERAEDRKANGPPPLTAAELPPVETTGDPHHMLARDLNAVIASSARTPWSGSWAAATGRREAGHSDSAAFAECPIRVGLTAVAEVGPTGGTVWLELAVPDGDPDDDGVFPLRPVVVATCGLESELAHVSAGDLDDLVVCMVRWFNGRERR